MNLTALANPVVQTRLYVAMRLAVKAAHGTPQHQQKGPFQIASYGHKGSVYIQNKKGNNFIRVDYNKAHDGMGKGFTFYGHSGDITKTVIQSLRA